ncbi:TonB-dependent receptor [Xanthocytophaga agilis]|uniref:TonB-dependent receptor n=1 Tax=Xanthocytophaga agilis TaxID=3048010 RepID=A0AAE3RAF4_9BACT|nr:TonB-dependent receptor [Xanthocytophaga agilis]MDJ1504477.1 TonB-dependent receptor [Xanthocytophaga agilis]
MRKLFLFSMCFFCISGWLIAQERTITGQVTSSSDQQPLPGVSVIIKGTARGSSTDASGKYTLSVPENATLVFSFIGYLSKEVPVGNQSIIDVPLITDVNELSEIVVTGYGSQIKRDVTGNIARVTSKEIENTPTPSLDAALQGRAAGVLVNQGTGKLGQAVQVRIRGASSISAGTQPLYVVDGIVLTTGDQSSSGGATNPLADINFNDVESFEILKDASAAAIYGSRAANGVVVITTKRGKSAKTNVAVNYQTGISKPTRRVRMLNATEYVNFYRQAAANSDRIEEIDPASEDSYTTYMNGFFDYYSAETFGTDKAVNTNWQDEIFLNDAPSNQIDLNVSGGSDKTRFFISGQYLDQKGILIGNAFNRISGRINLDQQVSKIFKFGFNLSLARSFNDRLSGDRQFDNPLQAAALTPISPTIDPTTGLAIGTPPGDPDLPNYYNPLINIGNAYYRQIGYRNISNVFGELTLLEGLTFRSEFGIDILNQQEEAYYNAKTNRNTSGANGLGQNYYTGVLNYTTNNYFSYNKVLGIHSLGLTLGTSYQQSQTKRNYIEGRQFPGEAYRLIQSAALKSGGFSRESNFRFLSYFLRANYKLNEKYLLSVSARIDGSSRFGKNSKYGFFPAASAGWVLSEEDWLKDNSFMSFLKLRTSYGLTGNAEIGNFPQLGLFAGDGNYGDTPGQRPYQLSNPNLKWETTTQTDVGIDFGFFNNRISGEIDYYFKETKDLLLNVNVPGSTGFPTIVQNVGKLQNQGWEFVLNTQNLVNEFKWTTSLNLSSNRNKVINIQGQIIEAGLENMSRVVEGQPIGVFYTAEYAGVDPANGDALWYKNTPNADGSRDRTTTNDYTETQRVVSGNPWPSLVGGITNTFNYKGFDLSVFFNGQYGNKINFYGVGRYSSANGRYEDNQTADQLNAWTPQNTNTNIPEARLFYNNGAQPSTRFIYDGSFLRLRTLTLGYTIPQSIINKAKISKAHIYFSAQNLLTITNYKGWDPEVNADDIVSNIAQGYDFYSAPQAKTFLVGINVNF